MKEIKNAFITETLKLVVWLFDDGKKHRTHDPVSFMGRYYLYCRISWEEMRNAVWA